MEMHYCHSLAAKRLRIAPSTLTRHAKEGRIRTVKVPHQECYTFYTESELLRHARRLIETKAAHRILNGCRSENSPETLEKQILEACAELTAKYNEGGDEPAIPEIMELSKETMHLITKKIKRDTGRGYSHGPKTEYRK